MYVYVVSIQYCVVGSSNIVLLYRVKHNQTLKKQYNEIKEENNNLKLDKEELQTQIKSLLERKDNEMKIQQVWRDLPYLFLCIHCLLCLKNIFVFCVFIECCF